MKYLVCMDVTAVAYAEIEASSEEEAQEKLEKLGPKDVAVEYVASIDNIAWVEKQE